MRQALHPDQHTARPGVRAPAVHDRREMPPAAEIEVTDAEVRPGGAAKGAPERRQEPRAGAQIVEDARHACPRLPSYRIARLAARAEN